MNQNFNQFQNNLMFNNNNEMNNALNNINNNQMININNMNNINQINNINQMNNMFIMNNNMNQINNNINQINKMNNQMIFINQMNNMNNMNQNYPMEQFDVYPYIKENKKNIIFSRINNSNILVKIPISLRYNELYSTARKYRINIYSDIKLFYKNQILNEDESTIDNILDNDIIYIYETLEGIDPSYYNLYLYQHNNEKQFNIIFNLLSTQVKKVMRFTLNTTIEEMIILFFCEMKISKKYQNNFKFIYNSITLNENEKSTLIQKGLMNNSNIIIIELKQLKKIFEGKILNVTLKNKNKKTLICEINAGTLQQIKNFYSDLENSLTNYLIKDVEAEGHNLKKDDERTLSSIGIRNDFICYIGFKNKKDKDESCCIII
jgi:hypothetical protein